MCCTVLNRMALDYTIHAIEVHCECSGALCYDVHRVEVWRSMDAELLVQVDVGVHRAVQLDANVQSDRLSA